MPKLLLLRAFVETSNGGYYSPLHGDGCASLLPIPDNRDRYRVIPDHLLANNIVDQCTGIKLSQYYPLEHGLEPLIHRDPRLDLGFYTGYYAPKGRLPKKRDKRLGRGDYLLFMAGLAKYPEDFWSRRRRLGEIKKMFRRLAKEGKTGIYIVGGLHVLEVIDIGETGWSKTIKKYSFLAESPHYYRVDDQPVAVIGKPLRTSPIKIADSSGKPTGNLVSLVGWENALRIARNNYRKSRIIYFDGDLEKRISHIIVF